MSETNEPRQHDVASSSVPEHPSTGPLSDVEGWAETGFPSCQTAAGGVYVETLRLKTLGYAQRTRVVAQNDRLDLRAAQPHVKPLFQSDIYTARYSLNK